MRSAAQRHAIFRRDDQPANDNNISGAREWLRRWYAIGGTARNSWRDGFVLRDRRLDYSKSLPLLAELKRSGLNEAVMRLITAPEDIVKRQRRTPCRSGGHTVIWECPRFAAITAA